jgi:type IV pilus assembly protein PilQ
MLPLYTFAKENTLEEVKVLPLPDNRVRIVFLFKDILRQEPASFVTKKPARIVLDFLNTKDALSAIAKSKKVDLGSLKAYQLVTAANRMRIILDLTQVVSYSSDIVGREYSVTLAGDSKQLFEPPKETFVANRFVRTKHLVKHIDFRGTEKNGGKLIIDVSDANMAIKVNQRGKRVYVEFFDTRIPKRLLRRYDVVDFHTPAQIVNATQRGKNAKITIRNKGDYGHFAYQVNKQFFVDIFPLTPEEIKLAKLKKKVFSGKRISLNFQNIQVRAVLQLLAEFTGTNMVISDSVTGDITLRLNNIPWDQALNIIMTTRGLGKRQMGDILLIAPSREIADREKSELQARQQYKKLAPLRAELLQINYAKAADIAVLLKDKNNSLLSERGTVSVDSRTNTIWIQDTSSQIEEVKELVKQLDIPVKQVLIEARVVLVNKDFEQDIGIRFGVSRPTHLSGTLEGANELANGVSPPEVPIPQRLNVDLAALPSVGTPATLGIALAKLGEGILLDLELSALESEGQGEVISSPRLITANQQAALIEAGEEIPYQEATSSGATAVAFKKAVLSLKVTPQITPDSKIILDLTINQDTPSAQRFNGVPAINTREIQTNVLVNNGQTIVLGGIYRQEKRNSMSRVPFLGSLPILGVFFRSKQAITEHEELLIFITPKIIRNTLTITGLQENTLMKGVDKFGNPIRMVGQR